MGLKHPTLGSITKYIFGLVESFRSNTINNDTSLSLEVIR